MATNAAQRGLLATALATLERTVAGIRAAGSIVPFIDLPWSVLAAETGADAAAAPELAGACSLVFLALDIFDDLADGDWREEWSGHRPAEMTLVAATLLSALPSLIIGQLDAPDATRIGMQARLSTALLRMSAGQQADLASVDAAEIAPEAVEAAVRGKSGEQHALYCALAALLAGAEPDRVTAYAEMGLALGTAGQLGSDCHELLCDPAMRDLANGTRTMPVALHLRRLDDNGHDAFLKILDEARHSDAARREVRSIIKDSGAVRRVLVLAAVHVERARSAAVRACPDPARRKALEPLFA